MKNLYAFRIPLAIAGLFAIGFFLVFIGLFAEDPQITPIRFPGLEVEEPEPQNAKRPRFGE
jgi:hypothetical protein